VVSYEKAEDWADLERREALTAAVRAAGLHWVPLRYHQRPSAPATAYDLAVGLLVCSALCRRHGVRLVHARSYVPAVLAVILQRVFGTRFVFDMRGFWADERVEAGLWPTGSRMYRAAKWFERRFLEHADVVVSLTQAGAAVLRESPAFPVKPRRVVVIPTCTDLATFTPAPLEGMIRARDRATFTLGYVGNAGLWYLFDVALQCFAALLALRPGARLLVLNRGQHDYIRERFVAYHLPQERLTVKAVEHTAVAGEVRAMDAGVFFIRPTFAKLASAPTRLGEYLGSGVPCLANAGVGDVERILEGEKAGVVLHRLDVEEIRKGVRRLVDLAEAPDTASHCRAVAEKYFDLAGGIAAYRRLYAELLGRADEVGSPLHGLTAR
jgi:glycosyltransferase involved in cell wall biosynthesis